MRKHRKWLMGLGIGMILGACMLELMNFAQAQDKAILQGSGELSRIELEQAAKKQNLELRTADEKTYTKQELDQAVEKARAELQKVQPKQDANARTVKLYIKHNTTLEEAAWKLEALEVISDADDFITKAYSIRRKIGMGTGTFHGKMSDKQIMDELIRPKND